jgi:hypothetical protein
LESSVVSSWSALARTGTSPTVASRFSITLMMVTVVLWISFFIADHHARKRIDGEANRRVVVDLLTLTGTFLAVFTLLGIGFFVVIAPRVP